MNNVDWLALWADFAQATDNEQLEVAEIVYYDDRWDFNELSSSKLIAAERRSSGSGCKEKPSRCNSWKAAAMAEHKFKIGQLVYFQLGKQGRTPPGHYQIIRRLPESDGEFHYVIRSTYEDHERVAREGELTRI